MLRKLIVGLLAAFALIALVLAAGYFALRRGDIPYEALAAKYESPASAYLDLPGGVRMHYRDEGARGAPALLLLHGYSSSLHTWEPWVRELGDAYRVISLDLPGHGLTRAPADYTPSIEAYRDIVHEAARALDLSRFALAGNSMGGNVAWEYALAFPEQVQALVLVDASGWRETRAESADDALIFQLLRNAYIAPLLRDLDNTRLIRGGLESSFRDRSFVEDAMVTRYAELSRAPGHRDILMQMALAFNDRNHATPDRLAALRMPVLILHGRGDTVVPFAHAEQFEAAIAGAQLVTLDAGHLPHEEIAAESAEAVDAFLAPHLAASPQP